MKASRVFAFGLLGLGLLAAPAVSFAQTAPRTPTAMLPSCQGIPVSDWNASKLTTGVTSVQEIRPETPVSETESVPQRWGARIVVPAQPGWTPEWLQRVADCHSAQVAASEVVLSQSPLDVKGGRVIVQSTGTGFSVDITSGDPRVGRDILARARTLGPTYPTRF